MKKQDKKLSKAEYQEEKIQEVKRKIEDDRESYIKTRNSLINQAVFYTDNLIGSNKNLSNWNKIYFAKMDELAFKKGLQSVRFHKDPIL